jgi:hypothetical protein
VPPPAADQGPANTTNHFQILIISADTPVFQHYFQSIWGDSFWRKYNRFQHPFIEDGYGL